MTKEEEGTEEVTEPEAKAIPPEQEDRIVDKVVNKIKEIVLAPGEILDEATKDEPDDKPAKEPSSVKEIENDMEAQVRAQLKKIGAEEEHAKQHEALKKEIERPPVQVGRVTRALWGGGDS